TVHDLTARLHDEFVADVACDVDRVRCVRGVDHHLQEAPVVAQVEEDEAAEIAPARDPARDDDAPARVGGAKVARLQFAPAGHARSLARRSASLTGAAGRPQGLSTS